MAAKSLGYFPKIVAVVFTSLVAPVMVNMTITAIKPEDSVSRRNEQTNRAKGTAALIASAPPVISNAEARPPQSEAAVIGATAHPVEVTQIIVRGKGKSPEAALQDALRNGLSRAIANQTGTEAWNRYGQVLLKKVSCHSAGLIRSWKEIGTSKELKLTGTFYYKEVAMEVDHHALAERLRYSCAAGQP